MLALSVLQPGATLLMLGARRIETRSWHTRHRGPLAIHAARRRPPHFTDLCERALARAALAAAGIEAPAHLPRGAVLGTIDLLDCVRVEELGPVAEAERALTTFAAGRWAWLLANPTPWPTPLPARGRLGLFWIEPGECPSRFGGPP